MTTKNQSYDPNLIMFDICQQRKRQQMNNIPPVRLEIMNSPYTAGYTQHQLNMRRKIEILKYNPTTRTNQTNSQTRKENLSSILKGNYKQIYDERGASIKCPNDKKIPTPSSSCDVPGPVVILTYDEKVPLYNYVNSLQTRSYSTLPQDITIPWSIYYLNNVDYIISNLSNVSTYDIFSSIYFRYILNQPNIYFTLTMPLVLSVNAIISENNNNINNKFTMNINIQRFILDIFYNQIEKTEIIDENNNHLSKLITIPDISGGQNVLLENIVIGYIQIPKIPFNSQTGYIYDLKGKFNINTTIIDKNTVTNIIINPNIGYLFKEFIITITANPLDKRSINNKPYILSLLPPHVIPPFSLVSDIAYVGNPPTLY